MNRRIFGMLSKRLNEAGLDEIADTRDNRGKRWRLGSLLRAVVGGMLVGSKSLAEVETLSTRLSRRSVTQRSDERRATPWKTLMSDCFFALITTTAAELLRPPRAVC